MINNVPQSEIAEALLKLEKVAENRYQNSFNQDNQLGVMFGGQLLAQGMAAAQQTAPSWPVHNCNAYFPSPGSSREPVEYQVENVRDGKRYANRRVLGLQGGRTILDMLCSFNDPRQGIEHQTSAIPDLEPPESMPTEKEFIRANADRLPDMVVAALTLPFPIEICAVDIDKIYFEGCKEPKRHYWLRFPSADKINDDAGHACLLAFLSDYRLGSTPFAPHLSPLEVDRLIVATLNHSLWIHRPVRTDQWLLFTTDSPWAAKGRGLARGSMYNREGQLIATAVQELMVGVR